ncbi:hypothetical protein BpHYR1_014640 [Brachionus plicatilis]|uniref:Uncharacterized protein n=1 Tax=Brachionus plicatilis TaxID=10195 RepID=A0A3M7QXI3_BRAPC|nr:hypothetical protein BpHYR1_014640 [Brachionus plicatilis]
MCQEESFEQFIKNLSKLDEWANHFSFMALSIFLKKRFFIYNFDLLKKIPYSSKVDMCENREKPITIGFLNHHFVPLLTTKFDKVKEILLFIASQKHLP